MRGMEMAGGYITNAYWEYAPVGRPHLYPPLLHLAMLLFYRLGLSAINIARLLEAAMIPLTFISLWFITRGLWNKRATFLSSWLPPAPIPLTSP